MDESWRMRMGVLPSAPPTRHRPSASRRRDPISDSDDPLKPEDFSDVFGGPPRTILSRQFSSSVFPRPTIYFYEEIFRPPEKTEPAPARRSGRSLPEFRIPGQQRNGFYSDIFGCEDERVVKSRSRSKTSSSSVLSSEELSPLRPAFSVERDDDVSSFASKLRPINVKCRWDSGNEDMMANNQSFHHPPFGRNTSPETIPISNSSFRVSADDMELNSPVSSVCHSLGRKGMGEDEDKDVLMQNELEDEAMSSYVIEINSNREEGTCESNGVDEAIAWAKERFQTHSSDEKTSQDVLNGHQVSEGFTDSSRSLDQQQLKWEIVEDEEESLQCSVQTEMDILDEKIRLWSTGKEADIRLLLSSLHHILWPNSGWLPAPLANIIEACHVKKAYQRARLCLHPDKLQQRGAKPQQKYIAEKAFAILQDAWGAFISLDVL